MISSNCIFVCSCSVVIIIVSVGEAQDIEWWEKEHGTYERVRWAAFPVPSWVLTHILDGLCSEQKGQSL